jgi:hypothetical protein
MTYKELRGALIELQKNGTKLKSAITDVHHNTVYTIVKDVEHKYQPRWGTMEKLINFVRKNAK